MNRRDFMSGLAGIFAAGYAPAVFSSGVASGILMPVREIAFLDSAFIANDKWHTIYLPPPFGFGHVVAVSADETPLRIFGAGNTRYLKLGEHAQFWATKDKRWLRA